jgi:predicted Rossmann fold flavoprotein
MAESRLVVIGGGSSGMMAAIWAARCGARVTLLEQRDRVGKKLLATGSGRCNLTNRGSLPARYHGGDPAFIRAVLERFPADAAIAFFAELGIECKVEPDERVYPRTGQASAVLDALRWEMGRLAVDVRTGHGVVGIRRQPGGFALALSAGGELQSSRLVLAAGGMAGPQFGSDGSGLRLASALGHTLVEPVAALVPLRLRTDVTRRLKGVSFSGRAEVRGGDELLRAETGEFLFTDSGISGPAVLQLSRAASVALQRLRPVRIVVDFFPEASLDEMRAALQARFERQAVKSLADALVGLLHKRLIPVLLAEAGIVDPLQPAARVPAPEQTALARLLKGWPLPVSGTMPWPEAQITAGGIALDEVDPATLESRRLPGLFFCGEILDVDGDCGGFNLQWAWSSGFLAGQSAAGN